MVYSNISVRNAKNLGVFLTPLTLGRFLNYLYSLIQQHYYQQRSRGYQGADFTTQGNTIWDFINIFIQKALLILFPTSWVKTIFYIIVLFDYHSGKTDCLFFFFLAPLTRQPFHLYNFSDVILSHTHSTKAWQKHVFKLPTRSDTEG